MAHAILAQDIDFDAYFILPDVQTCLEHSSCMRCAGPCPGAGIDSRQQHAGLIGIIGQDIVRPEGQEVDHVPCRSGNDSVWEAQPS